MTRPLPWRRMIFGDLFCPKKSRCKPVLLAIEAASEPISEEQFDELTEKLKRENVFIEEHYAKQQNIIEDSADSFLEPVPLSIK